MSTMEMPRWVKALLTADGVVLRAARLEMALRDELLWAWVPAEKRAVITEKIYAAQPTYTQGGGIFERGIHLWEERLLNRPEIPRQGRVLLGGAGGGRELAGLISRGYDATAFDPCEALVRAAAQALTERAPASRVLVGAYEDLLDAADGRGPLARVRDDGPYAFVWLGWRSLSHVCDERARADLFSALARLAPLAPIIVSFAPPQSVPGKGRRLLRRAFAWAGAPSSAPDGALFLPWAGFAVELDRAAIERASSPSGYTLAFYDENPDGHALLVQRRG